MYSRIAGALALGSLAVLLGGCSGMSLLTTPVASYGAANIFAPTGYSQTKLDDMHYQVKAMGTEATPKERVEKIARARAAQIGVDEKLEYFKVTSVQHGVSCTARKESYKSGPTPASSRPTVVLDVVYAKEAADPAFASSGQAYEALSADLANEVVPPEAKAIAAQETRASCGEG